MTSNIYRANQVDKSKFSFGDQTVNKYGGKSSRVKYDGSDFFIQTPRMRLPYGLGAYEDKDPNTGEVKKLNIQLICLLLVMSLMTMVSPQIKRFEIYMTLWLI